MAGAYGYDPNLEASGAKGDWRTGYGYSSDPNVFISPMTGNQNQQFDDYKQGVLSSISQGSSIDPYTSRFGSSQYYPSYASGSASGWGGGGSQPWQGYAQTDYDAKYAEEDAIAERTARAELEGKKLNAMSIGERIAKFPPLNNWGSFEQVQAAGGDTRYQTPQRWDRQNVNWTQNDPEFQNMRQQQAKMQGASVPWANAPQQLDLLGYESSGMAQDQPPVTLRPGNWQQPVSQGPPSYQRPTYSMPDWIREWLKSRQQPTSAGASSFGAKYGNRPY